MLGFAPLAATALGSPWPMKRIQCRSQAVRLRFRCKVLQNLLLIYFQMEHIHLVVNLLGLVQGVRLHFRRSFTLSGQNIDFDQNFDNYR